MAELTSLPLESAGDGRSRIGQAVASGRALVRCEAPDIDAGVAVGPELMLVGWAYSRHGIESVEVIVDGCHRVAARHGIYRPDVTANLGLDSTALGFAAHLDTGSWAPGTHLVSVAARATDGEIARHAGTVEVAPEGPYRAWLHDTAAPAPAPAETRGLRRVTADGADLLEPLAELVRHGRGQMMVVATGGQLGPDAERAVAEAFAQRPAPDAVYGDEDAVVADGMRGAEFLKPGWSPELLLGVDYVGPLIALGSRAAAAVVDAGPGPVTTIYELAVRLVDTDLRVLRVPRVLFTCDAPHRPEDGERASRAIGELGERRRLVPRIEPGPLPETRQVGWNLRGSPRVSIVIPTAATHALLDRCIDSIREHTSYRDHELVIVDSSGGRLSSRSGLLDGLRHRIVAHQGEFNFSRACNAGAAAASGDHLLFLNDDTEVRSEDWIERMLEHAQVGGVGIVGAKLVYPDGSVQHAGVNVAPGARGAAHLFNLVPDGRPGYRGMLSLTRNCTAVTAACMMVEAELFEELGGFDEGFAIEYGDTDLCVRAIDAGRRVVWTPRAVLVHHEQSARGMTGHLDDARRFEQRWRRRFADGDPLYHPAFATYPSYQYATHTMRAPRVHSSRSPEHRRASIERFVPESAYTGRLIDAEHRARYHWAASAAAGKQVLDAGCGVGYGTRILADAGAARVVGVDRSGDAVEAAAARVGDRAELVVGDLQALPFEDRSFDLVACFEAIEHVADAERALDELRRVLSPDGLLLVSSPNRGEYLPGNPWHVHEFTPDELERSLGRRFANVGLHRQQVNLASAITDDAGFAASSSDQRIEAVVRRVTGSVPGRELYTLAAASDASLPDLAGEVVLSDTFDVTALSEHALTAAESAWSAEAERDALSDMLERMKRSPSWRLTAPLRAAKRLAISLLAVFRRRSRRGA
jgi:GT2 family glycosyltransferase/ubiquinone/menaquinone biosynthesis C-methylase UbiE